MTRYLLDTNQVSALMYEGPKSDLLLARAREERANGAQFLLCPIVESELHAMVCRADGRPQNSSRLASIIDLHDHCLRCTVDLAAVCGRLKADCARRWAPLAFRDEKRRLKLRKILAKIGVTEGDIWIASYGIHYGATVVTDDAAIHRIATLYPALKLDEWVRSSVEAHRVVAGTSPWTTRIACASCVAKPRRVIRVRAGELIHSCATCGSREFELVL